MAQSSEVTQTIVNTVADYENTSPEVLPPLADKLDAETYNQLTASKRQLTERLEFEYLWYQVTVEPDGEVIFRP